MRLGMHVLPKTEEQYLRELGEIAENSTTLVFLDTNILGYIYKLHSAARKDFFDWTEELSLHKQLAIPAWTANEYLSKFKSGKFSEYAPSRPEQVTNALNNLLETASLFVDEQLLKKIGFHGTRSNFLDDFGTSIKELSKFTCVFNHQFDTWSVHAEITSNLSKCILHSDLTALCARAATEGDVRNSHRLPPGFKDSGKPENKYGDLIIWYEILDESKKNPTIKTATGEDTPRHVLFVTNDEKSDWVYSPTKRLLIKGGAVQEIGNINPAIKLPDPRLVAEFRASTGHDQFHITTLPMLVKALSTIRPKGLESLASAIQIEDKGGSLTSETVAESADAKDLLSDMKISIQPEVIVVAQNSEPYQTENQGTATIRPENAPNISYPPDALRDGAYEADAPGDINEVIRALRSQNWYTQNPAVQRLKEFRQENFEPGQWFVLGRNIYQAACGNAQKSLEFMKNLDIELSRFPSESANHLLSGMLYEIYFNRDGNFRHIPKAAHIEQIMREATNERYQQSQTFILSLLVQYNNWVPFKPGATEILPLEINISEGEVVTTEVAKPTLALQSVKFLGQEKLIELEGENTSQLSGLFSGWGRSSLTASQIKSELSDNYAIPKWAIRIQLNMPGHENAKLHIPEGKALDLDRPPYPDALDELGHSN